MSPPDPQYLPESDPDLVRATGLVELLWSQPGADPKVRSTWAAVAAEALARVAGTERDRKDGRP